MHDRAVAQDDVRLAIRGVGRASDDLRHEIAVPRSVPTPNVIEAAATPIASCRRPARSAFCPVMTVMSAPTPKSAAALRAAAAATAAVPLTTAKGMSGTSAPEANIANDVAAAT